MGRLIGVTPVQIKTAGYLISSVSVVLLGAVAWKSAAEHPLMLACLIGGMALSILGMLLRWTSYKIEEDSKKER
jgi:biotin transporter BioY